MSERPSPIDFIKNANIEQRNKENQIRTENITRVLVENSGIFGGSIEEERSQQKSQEVLDVFGAGYKSAEEILNTLKNPSATDRQKEIAKENLGVLGKGIFVAMNKAFGNYSNEATETITSQLTGEQIDDILPPTLRGVGEYVIKVDKEATDEEKKKAKEPFTNTEEYQTTGKEESRKENKNNSGPDLAAMRDNRYAKDPKSEYRSPYEIDPSSFVDALFNQQNPRLYFTPPPEWVRKLPPKEQYLLKIQQKLASGAEYKLGVKDISAEKARQSEVYNLPETELKFIYEMPGVKEALETFVGDLLEPYSEDGRVFSRLKLGPDGRIDKSVAKKCGDIDSGFSFESFKEEMYKKMALKKLYPNKIGEINSDWETVYKDAIKDYIKKARDDFKNFRGNRGIIDNRTDAELENKWITDNALEEKRAVATAWNFLFVGHVIESADTKRSLKPSQINSDKLRTMMMPLEKFLQKASIRKGSLQGSEELFGGNLSLWAKRRMEEEGANFSQKLVYAADNDRTEMTDEQAKWRLMPKRTMCSFSDEYHVKTKDGEEMTFSEALRNKKEIVFKENDLDVFVSLRDTWDEVISVSPFLIGKGEYSPVQQPDKFASAVEKLKGLVTGINKIRLTPEEAARQGRAFGHEKYVDCPEFYAWLIANAVGIEINLDTPILNRAAIKADSDNYDVVVNNFVRLLNLNTGISLKVKEILNAEGWLSSKRAISIAEKRASVRESKRIKEEKRRR